MTLFINIPNNAVLWFYILLYKQTRKELEQENKMYRICKQIA